VRAVSAVRELPEVAIVSRVLAADWPVAAGQLHVEPSAYRSCASCARDTCTSLCLAGADPTVLPEYEQQRQHEKV